MAQRPTTGLLGQSFAVISSFLREGLADEDSRELRETLSDLSQGMEAVLQARRARQHAAIVGVQLPRGRDLVEQAQGGGFHARRLAGVDAVALHQRRQLCAVFFFKILG